MSILRILIICFLNYDDPELTGPDISRLEISKSEQVISCKYNGKRYKILRDSDKRLEKVIPVWLEILP